MKEKWITRTRGTFDFGDMCKEIEKFVESAPDERYEVSIGTDSQQHGNVFRFITSVVVYRVRRGAQYYYKIEYETHIDSLQQKIMYEATMTYKYKELLKDALEDLLLRYDINIRPHVDIGEDGETKKFISQITGMFKSFGPSEEALIKPYSYAASWVANKHSK